MEGEELAGGEPVFASYAAPLKVILYLSPLLFDAEETQAFEFSLSVLWMQL